MSGGSETLYIVGNTKQKMLNLMTYKTQTATTDLKHTERTIGLQFTSAELQTINKCNWPTNNTLKILTYKQTFV